MAGAEQIRVLIQELGEVLGFATVAEDAEAGAWDLVAKDETILSVELTADGERLWLSAGAGVPRPSDRERLYPLMLQYNALWQKNGGMRLGLDGPEGAVVLACDMPVAALGVPQLCAVVGNFLTVLDGWRKIVAAAAAAGTTAPAADATAGYAAAGGVIRG